jgi:hypothetical protein
LTGNKITVVAGEKTPNLGIKSTGTGDATNTFSAGNPANQIKSNQTGKVQQTANHEAEEVTPTCC